MAAVEQVAQQGLACVTHMSIEVKEGLGERVGERERESGREREKVGERERKWERWLSRVVNNCVFTRVKLCYAIIPFDVIRYPSSHIYLCVGGHKKHRRSCRIIVYLRTLCKPYYMYQHNATSITLHYAMLKNSSSNKIL